MAYVHRTVIAGKVIEHRKMQTARYHSKGATRQPNKATTADRQKKINDRVAEEHLRWLLNANFGYKDMHITLHYNIKDSTFEEVVENKKKFLRELRKECRKRGIKPKIVTVIETKRMTNPHIHVVISRMDLDIIHDVWERIPRGGGGVSYKPLDRRGNHKDLASYLMKESKSTMRKYKEMGKRGKRYSTSQGMTKPKIKYEVCNANAWRKEPKARKGTTLYKDKDGNTYYTGWHELTGYGYQEYFEVFNE